jgi:small GTP-binding protein
MILTIALVGIEKSGKTKLVDRLAHGSFKDEYKQLSRIVSVLKPSTDKYYLIDLPGLLAERDFHHLKEADVILLVVDSTQDFSNQNLRTDAIKKFAMGSNKELIIVLSKIDVENASFKLRTQDVILATKNIKTFEISSKTQAGIDNLENHLTQLTQKKQSFFDLKTSLQVIINRDISFLQRLNLFGKKSVLPTLISEINNANTTEALAKIIKTHKEYLGEKITQECLMLCNKGCYEKVVTSALKVAKYDNYGACSLEIDEKEIIKARKLMK